MKRTVWGFNVLLLTAIILSGCGGGGGGDGGGGGGEDPESSTFTSGGNTLNATTTQSGSTKTVTVTDGSGNTIVTAAITTEGVTLTGAAGTSTTTFNTALSGMPTNYAANVLGAYIAGQIAGYSAMCVSKDSPGCDWFPDLQCDLGCCADHDACYQMNGCSATSWLLIGSSLACINCNGLAELCILSACIGVTESRSTDRCYDNRCGQFYDCDIADCGCTSPCSDSPVACGNGIYANCCGNGSCEVGETQDNCYVDCREGSAYNTCCYENSDCPSEEAYACPGACCCCGYGEVCTRDGSHVCTGSASISVKGDLDPAIADILKRCEGKPKSECH